MSTLRQNCPAHQTEDKTIGRKLKCSEVRVDFWDRHWTLLPVARSGPGAAPEAPTRGPPTGRAQPALDLGRQYRIRRQPNCGKRGKPGLTKWDHRWRGARARGLCAARAQGSSSESSSSPLRKQNIRPQHRGRGGSSSHHARAAQGGRQLLGWGGWAAPRARGRPIPGAPSFARLARNANSFAVPRRHKKKKKRRMRRRLG